MHPDIRPWPVTPPPPPEEVAKVYAKRSGKGVCQEEGGRFRQMVRGQPQV
jgi:hypothetical protein